LTSPPAFTVPGGLYAILDESLVVGDNWGEAARALLSGGARVIQLRAKTLGAGEMLAAAKETAARCEAAGATFIVNDRVDVALATGAGGVHVGQEDLPVRTCRKIMPSGSIIGLSTHSMEEALGALDAGADYIGFGPVFETGTKVGALPPRGPDALARIVDRIPLPVVAIGGISAHNIREVRNAGAVAGAVISGLGAGGKLDSGANGIIKAWGNVE